jgi:hypothetical protein
VGLEDKFSKKNPAPQDYVFPLIPILPINWKKLGLGFSKAVWARLGIFGLNPSIDHCPPLVNDIHRLFSFF